MATWYERHIMMVPFEKLFTVMRSTSGLRYQLPVEYLLLAFIFVLLRLCKKIGRNNYFETKIVWFSPLPFTTSFLLQRFLSILLHASETLRTESIANVWVYVGESETCQSLRVSVNSAESKTASAERIARPRARKT